MITVGNVFDYLCTRYPLDTACDFDNPGLLVGDSKQTVTKALVVLDCDISAVEEAIAGGYELIITHHPVIWDGLRSVTAEGIVYRLIRAGISVISMHTNLDIARGGVNDRLCEELGLSNIETYTATDGFLLRKGNAQRLTADCFAEKIKRKLGGAVKYVAGEKTIDRVLVCSGSGGGYLKEAISGGFDALVTADVKHSVFIDAINAGISLFDAGHYDTEKVICAPLSKELYEKFPEIKITPFTPDLIKSI